MPHLNELIQEQNLPKSFLSKVSNWFYERSFWFKLSLGLLITAIGGVIGMLFMPYFTLSPLVSAVLGLASYLLPSMLLWQHHRAEKKQQEALALKIITLKKELQESISAFNLMGNSMKKILSSMQTKNQAMGKDAEALKTSVNDFTNQIHDSEDALRHVQESGISVAHHTQNLQNTIQELTVYPRQFNLEQTHLTQINDQMRQTQAKLEKSAKAHNSLLRDIQHSTEAMNQIIETHQLIQTEAEENQKFIREHISSIQKTINTIPHQETATQQSVSNEELREKMLTAVDQITRQHNKLQTPSTQKNKPKQSVRM